MTIRSCIILGCFAIPSLLACQKNRKTYTIAGVTYTNIPFDGAVPGEADSLIVLKKERRLFYFMDGQPVKGYTISLGSNPGGHKECEGDRKTPEGRYSIDGKNPNSDYHKNLGVSYPNEADRRHAASLGKPPGGDIKIHGFPNGKEHFAEYYLSTDWTWGCIAVSNEAVDELYEHVPTGVPIIIYP